MGMFNYVVNVPFDKCIKCGHTLTKWQSKDNENHVLSLEEIDYKTVDNFYTFCDTCSTWHEFYKNFNGNLPTPEVEGYILKISRLGDPH